MLSSPAMIVRLCTTGLQKLGPPGAQLVATLRERGITPAPQTCLDRCQTCERQVIAVADGIPLAAPTVDLLLAQITEMAAEDEDF